MSQKAAGSGLTLAVERYVNAVVVRCSGRLVAGVNERLYVDVRQLIPDSKRIVLDLAELTHMDSMGLGTLVRLYVSAKSAGCTLELKNVGKPIDTFLALPIFYRYWRLSAKTTSGWVEPCVNELTAVATSG